MNNSLYPQAADSASTLLPHDFYYEIGAYVFPVNMQTKKPFANFAWKRLASNDREQHRRWAAEYPGCGWAMYAAKSRFLVADKDIKNVGEAVAQATWEAECRTAKLPRAVSPNVTTPSGGAHMYFRLPDGVDETTLTQPDWVKGIIDVRTVGYVLIPPSMRDGKAYNFVRRETEPCPAEFLERFTQKIATDAEEREARGDFDFGLVSSVVRWILNNTDRFDAEFDWVFDTLAVRDAFPDDRGYSLACEMAYCDQQNRLGGIWNRKNDYRGKPRTCATLIKYARDNGYTGRTASEMFGGVTVAAPTASGAIPLMGAQQVICDEGMQIIAAFNQAHSVPRATDAPALPIEMNAAPLCGPLTEAIGKMVTLADTQRAALKFDVIGDVLGVLAIAHEPTLAPVIARIRQTGAVVPDNRIKRATATFEAHVNRELRVGQGWRTNNKGEPDPDVSENVDVLLDRLGASLRFNLWKQRPEYRRGDETWRPLTDDTVKSIWMDARSENIRYKVSKPFLQDAFDAICHRTEVDPALDKINSIVWDGIPRLDFWLHYTCGAPVDSYYRAVARNVVGGIVKRLRHPGCKHDETLLLIGEQGTGKSSVAHILALHKDWHTDTLDVKLPVKELAPAMSAKLVVEFAEIDQYTRKDVARVKQFITTINDAGTMKFDKYASDHFRRCIFICTTNSDTPLKDATGNRRFLPVHVMREVDEQWLRQNVEQIIAEAAHYEGLGETFGIPRDVWADADVRQEAVRDLTPEEEAVFSWFGETEKNRECRWMWASDLADAFRHQRMNPKAKIGRTMKSMGYESDRRTVGSRRDRCWFRSWPKYSELPQGARQWCADLKIGQPVAKWRLLSAAPTAPTQLTPAQVRVMQMRTSPCVSGSA